MQQPRWISEVSAMAFHSRSLVDYGGTSGLTNEGSFLSALAKPAQTYAYKTSADYADLAATLAYGLIKNHPFIDGNKRTALIASFSFLKKNNYEVIASEYEAFIIFEGVAEDKISQQELAEWFSQNILFIV